MEDEAYFFWKNLADLLELELIGWSNFATGTFRDASLNTSVQIQYWFAKRIQDKIIEL
jgi:hypothetical protein